MWAFDRFTRLLRLLILNYGAFSRNPQNHHLARAKFVRGTDVIQLTVYPSAQDVGYFPGAHYFVFLGGTWRFWECHPFTAAGWRNGGPVLTTMPHPGPKMKRSLQGSLNASLRESRLPPRARLVAEKVEKNKEGPPPALRHLATLKELGFLKEIPVDMKDGGMVAKEKEKKQEKNKEGPPAQRHLATLKELGFLKEIPVDTKDGGVVKEKEKKQEKHIYIVKQSGKNKDIFIVADNGKGKELVREGTQTPVPGLGMPERKLSVKQKLKEKEMAKVKELQRTRSQVKKKASQESSAKTSSKGSDTGTDRGEEKESESEKPNDTTEDSEKVAVSEEEDRDEFEGVLESIVEEEKQKVLTSVVEIEDEEYDEFVEINQDVFSSIASTARKGAQRPKLTFFIKPRRGMTATLADRIREHEEQNKIHGFPRGRELEIKCLIEGAYGVSHPLHLFETVVLIAGGVGITTILPYLVDYMERARGPEKRTLTQRLVFLWTAKEEELVENLVARKFPKGCLTRTDISMQLYVTKNKAGQKKLPGVKYRRPKIPEILKSEQMRVVGKMAVMSCGPSVLVDIVRDAVVGCLDAERKHVEYFEESY